jgi:N-acyl-D-amino-acid deacylase
VLKLLHLRPAANPDRIGRMRRLMFSVVLLTCVCGVAAALGTNGLQNATQQPFDILIRNGRVLDGSGNPWRRADIGIRGDRIVAVGTLTGATAATVVDARDRVVAPGFFDVHSHALEGLTRAELRDGRPLLAQGVTTIVGNPDGGGGTDLKRQFATIDADGGVGVNVALLIGHASIRSAVLGDQQRRDPTAAELELMIALVKQGVADGAFGLSSGLFYQPGRFSKTEEVIALARAAGGVYSSHIRDEGDYDYGLIASVDEVIRIAEEARVRGVVSHVKALGPDNWGKSKTIVEHVDAARARGVEVYADQYPYEASSTSLSAAVMPSESSAALKEAMAGEESKKAFLALVRENIRRRGGPRSIVIASGRGAPNAAGKHLEDIAKAGGVTPEQAAVDVVLAGGASIVSFNMSEQDIELLMKQSWTMASSDGGLSMPGPSRPHPRGNGAFARRLAHYVRNRQVLPLEQAVRGMTSMPAQVFGFVDRGEIRPGAFADIVIFDPALVQDKATYQDPHQIAEGMSWVIVNGQIARRELEFTGARAGRALKR